MAKVLFRKLQSQLLSCNQSIPNINSEILLVTTTSASAGTPFTSNSTVVSPNKGSGTPPAVNNLCLVGFKTSLGIRLRPMTDNSAPVSSRACLCLPRNRISRYASWREFFVGLVNPERFRGAGGGPVTLLAGCGKLFPDP